MSAQFILAIVSAIFFVAALRSLTQDRKLNAQSRTWLMIAIMFAGVSFWLFLRQA